MKRIVTFNATVIIFLLISANALMAQTTQNGIVKEYNERLVKTPLNQVEITISNAASTVSDEQGIFSLQFRTLKPGDKVNVRRIEKIGYEIFNKEALEQWFISRDNSPFTIIMCRSDRFKRIRDNYSRVSSQSYERQLKKEEARLAAERKADRLKEAEYEAALKKLNDDFDQQLENLDNYVDHFARIDLSELSDTEARIIELVQQGEIDRAIELYEAQDLEKKYEQQITVGRKAKTAIDTLHAIRQQSLLSRDSLFASILRKNEMLRLAGGKENFEKIGVSLKSIALADTTYYSAVFEYATFANSENMFEEALRFYNMCLRLTEREIDKCQLHEKIGDIWLRLNHFKEAERSILASHDIVQLLWSQDSTNYRMLMAEVQGSAARLYAKMKSFNEAEKYYLSAISNYSILSKDHFDMQEQVAELQAGLCEMYLDMRSFDKTDEMLRQAMANATKLYNTFPERHRLLMARVEGSDGRYHTLFMRYEAAEAAYKESLNHYKVLFEKNPSAYRPGLANIYDRLADLYVQTRNFDDSKTYAALAVAHYDTLVASSTSAYLPDIAYFKRKQGQLCQVMRRYADMKEYVEEGYKITTDLYREYPEVYRLNYCDLSTNLGICYALYNKMNDAETYFQLAKELADTLYGAYPDAYRTTYYNATKNLGSLYGMWLKTDLDSLYTTQAMNTIKLLYDKYPEVYQQEYAVSLYNYAVSYTKAENFQKADSIARMAEDLFTKLTKQYPEIFLDDYRRLVSLIGIIQSQLGNKTAEEEYKLKANNIAKILFDSNPAVYLDAFYISLSHLAVFYQEKGSLDKARECYEEALKNVRVLYNQNRDIYATKMGETLLSYALYCNDTKDYTSAWNIQREATSIYESLHEVDSGRHSFALGLCYTIEGKIQHFGVCDEGKAEALYLKALSMFFENKADGIQKAKLQIISCRKYLLDIYTKKKDYRNAYEQVLGILELDPDNQEIIEQKNLLEEELGK